MHRKSARTVIFLAALLTSVFPAVSMQYFTPDLGDVRNYDYSHDVKPHGFRMDSQHYMMVDQEDDWATIKVIKDQRAPGGPALYYDPETGEDESIIRFDDEQILAWIRSEVVIPAPGNYIGNPGRRYRITIKGVGVAPEFARVFEVEAAEARNAVINEMSKIYARAEGPYREALFWGTLVAVQQLNKKFHLPAEIPLTVLLSRGGQYRISGPWMERREQPRVERFSHEAFVSDPSASKNLHLEIFAGNGVPVTFQGVQKRFPDYRVPPSEWDRERQSRPAPYLERKNVYDREDIEPPDHKIQRVYDLGTIRKEDKPGLPGKPLTTPEVDLPAISASQIDSLDVLLEGEPMGPMESRASGRALLPLRPPARVGGAPEREEWRYKYRR